MEWQPIETAPKDGTNIMVYFSKWRGPTCGVAHWATPMFGFRNGGWFWPTGQRCADRPTHWIPLPTPPEGE